MEIIGNDKIREELSKVILKLNNGTLILNGPEGVGKKSFVVDFAKKNKLSFFLIGDKKNNSEEYLSINLARILKDLALKKNTDKQLIIIDNAQRLTLPAQNALLKTFEESSPNIIFILITSRLRSILPTIISRSFIFRFQLLTEEEMIKVLKYFNIDAHKYQKLINIYQGRPGKIISFLNSNNIDIDKMIKFIEEKNIVDKLKLLYKINSSLTFDELLEFMILANRLKMIERKRETDNLQTLINIWYETKTSYQMPNPHLQLINFILENK